MSGGKKISFDKLHKVKTFNGQSDDESDPLLGGGKGPPKDTFNLTYIIFYLHGIGHLLPWNFFITATDVCVCVCLLEVAKRQLSRILVVDFCILQVE